MSFVPTNLSELFTEFTFLKFSSIYFLFYVVPQDNNIGENFENFWKLHYWYTNSSVHILDFYKICLFFVNIQNFGKFVFEIFLQGKFYSICVHFFIWEKPIFIGEIVQQNPLLYNLRNLSWKRPKKKGQNLTKVNTVNCSLKNWK